MRGLGSSASPSTVAQKVAGNRQYAEQLADVAYRAVEQARANGGLNQVAVDVLRGLAEVRTILDRVALSGNADTVGNRDALIDTVSRLRYIEQQVAAISRGEGFRSLPQPTSITRAASSGTSPLVWGGVALVALFVGYWVITGSRG